MRGGPPDVILQYFSGLAAMLIIIFLNSLLFSENSGSVRGIYASQLPAYL